MLRKPTRGPRWVRPRIGGSEALEPMFLDPERSNLPLESRCGEAEPRRCASRSGDAPTALGEGRLYELPLAGCQLVGERPQRRGRCLPRQPARVDDERVRVAHDHRTLDDVLELTDVAGPAVGLNEVQRALVDLPDDL